MHCVLQFLHYCEMRPPRSDRQGFQRSQLTELASTGFKRWAKESFEIATKIAYRNGGRIAIPKGWQYGLFNGGSGSRASYRLRC